MKNASGGVERIRTILDPALAIASRRINGRGKRAFDIVIALSTLVFILPLIVSLLLIMRLDGRGAAIVGTPAIGRRGRPFMQLRFREAPWLNWSDRPFEDSLVARLPGFFNVLAGDLSLVGATPVDRDGLELYGVERRFYLVARPGLTTPWDRDAALPARVPALCKDYVLHWRLRRDLAVLRAAIFGRPRPRTP